MMETESIQRPAPKGVGPPPPEAAIEVSDVSLRFETRDGPVEALSHVSLKVARGEFVSFIGPSGCGKTTLLRAVADLEVADRGRHPRRRHERGGGARSSAPTATSSRRRRSIRGGLWRAISRCRSRSWASPGPSARSGSKKGLELVNLTGFGNKFPWQLSGGMQQRASIARALSFDPDILLDGRAVRRARRDRARHAEPATPGLWEMTGKTVLFVTHSIPEAVFLSTRIVVMSPRPGRITDVIECNFPRDRQLEIRETPEFLAIANRVRLGLRAGHSYDG